VFLSPGSEENYVSFLAVRKSPVTPLENPRIFVTEGDAINTTRKTRDLVVTDLALHEKAQKAFVSWVQSYTKHQASSIFPVSQLDWEDLGNAWGLLRLPKMPELKKWDGDRSLGVDINPKELKYKDAAREKRRLAELDQNEVTVVQNNNKKNKTEAWSAQKAMKETREVRREKRKARRDNEKRTKMTEEQLKEQKELDQMIAQVRAQNTSIEEEWKGFSD
jgi:ATP-dependent RNA helicase DDX55/SPB4